MSSKEKSSNNSGNLSGSFKNMLRQKGKSDEDKYRNSVSRISQKINSLRLTQQNDGEDCGTFIYKGNHSDSEDEELEAGETILDNSLLKQFTEQLDTFVYKGDSNDSDSDYATGDSVVKSKNTTKEEELSEDDADGTLIRQYSNTLEEEEEENSEENDAFDEKAGFPVLKLQSELKTMSEDTVTFDSFKYKYKGLKDTFQLKTNKARRRADILFDEDKNKKSAVRTHSLNEYDVKSKVKSRTKSGSVVNETGTVSKSRHSVPLSASFSGTSSLPMAGKKSKIQFSKTQWFDEPSDNTIQEAGKKSKTQWFEEPGDNTVKAGKMKVCDKIVESTKAKTTKPIIGRPHKPKQAFVEEKNTNSNDLNEYFDDPDRHVKGVISHLRGNLSPYPEPLETYINEEGRQESPENVSMLYQEK